MKGGKLSARSKLLKPSNSSQLSSPTHDIEIGKSLNYIAYSLSFAKGANIFHMDNYLRREL